MVKLSRKSRKTSRKSRKTSRKSRKGSRKNRMSGGADESLAQGTDFRRAQMQMGGAQTPLGGAPVGDTGMLEAGLRDIARVAPLDVSVSAATAHGQQGGSRKSRKNVKNNARKNRKTNALKTRKSVKSRKSRKINAVKSRKSLKSLKNNSRKSRKNNSRKSRKNNARKNNSRKNRKMYGGFRYEGSPLSAPPMLLTAAEAQKAGTADFNNPFLTK